MEIKKIECKRCLSSYPETLIPTSDQVCVYCQADEAEQEMVPAEKEETPTSPPPLSQEEGTRTSGLGP